jgi:hypothetical protein
MRQPTAALAVAVICVLIAGCGITKGNAGSTTTTRSMIPRPLVERELAGLLLSPEQVNVAMGATAMTVTKALSGWGAGKVRWGRIDDRDRCRLVV